jgi:3-hydroxypropanoate dehydrogenase
MAAKLSDDVLDTIFRKGRSYNGFTDAPFTAADADAIWELMKFGPTSANLLPARLVWCFSQESKEKLAALSSGTNGEKILKAPATVIIAMDTDFHEQAPILFPHAPGVKDWFPDPAVREIIALRNSSLQGGYFILAARALGFDTGPMSGFENAAVDAAFFADTAAVKSNFIATIGVGDPSTIFERLPRPPFETFNKIV